MDFVDYLRRLHDYRVPYFEPQALETLQRNPLYSPYQHLFSLILNPMSSHPHSPYPDEGKESRLPNQALLLA